VPGEFLCLIPFALTVWSDHRAGSKSGRPRGFHSETNDHKVRTLLSLLLPTLCDACATTLLNIGLFYTCAPGAPRSAVLVGSLHKCCKAVNEKLLAPPPAAKKVCETVFACFIHKLGTCCPHAVIVILRTGVKSTFSVNAMFVPHPELEVLRPSCSSIMHVAQPARHVCHRPSCSFIMHVALLPSCRRGLHACSMNTPHMVPDRIMKPREMRNRCTMGARM